MKKIRITHEEFAKMLAAHKGAAILRIEAVTDARAKKTDNPHGTIYRQKDFRCVVGANYQKGVNTQLEKLGRKPIFKADELPYGKFEVKDKVIKTDAGEYQLRIVERNPRPPIIDQFFSEKTGRLDKSEAAKYLPKKTSFKQEDVGLYGKRQVKCRNYSFKNIRFIIWKGNKYVFKS